MNALVDYQAFKIDYPTTPEGKKQWNKLYGMNAYYSGKHWAERQKDAQYWHTLTTMAMDRADVTRTPYNTPVVIFFRWNDKLDLDNHAVMGKMIVDAMKGRVIKDDDRNHLVGICHLYHEQGDYIDVRVVPIRNFERSE